MSGNPHGPQAIPPHTKPTNCVPPMFFSPPTTPASGFSILAIAIVGIMFTSILLVGYYIFAIKCCFNRHPLDLLRRFSISQARRQEDPWMIYPPAAAVVNRGLDEVLIRAIPIVQFKKNEDTSFVDCAVCLNEFQEEEKLRVLPSCSHAFHIDCIDVWLQNNANCPLCRSYISSDQILSDQIISPTSSPQDPAPLTGINENFVVIESRDEESVSQTNHNPQETGDSSLMKSDFHIFLIPGCLESHFGVETGSDGLKAHLSVPKKTRKLHHMSSMGDECINVRGKDDQFSIQPIRRSFSMDFSANQQLYPSVQQSIQQNRNLNEVSTGDGCSSSSSRRIRRPFFSFGQSRGSRSAILPIQFEP